MGCPPTDLKARTGELTPPGIRALAALKMAWEWLVFRVEAVTGTGAKGQLQTVQHLDPRTARCVFYVVEA
jgi:hypothetical protein